MTQCPTLESLPKVKIILFRKGNAKEDFKPKKQILTVTNIKDCKWGHVGDNYDGCGFFNIEGDVKLKIKPWDERS